MAVEQNGKQQNPDLSPRTVWASPDLRNLAMQDIQYLQMRDERNQSAYVDRVGGFYKYDREFVGVPFLFCTEPVFVVLPKTFGGDTPQNVNVCRVGVRIVNLENGNVGEPEVAEFSRRWVYFDIKGRTVNELRGHIYTLGYDVDAPWTPQGEPPLRLKVYEFGIDKPESVEADALTEDNAADDTSEDVTEDAPAPTPAPTPAPAAQALPGRRVPGLDKWQANSAQWGASVADRPMRGMAPQVPMQVPPVRRGPGRPRKDASR